ncbi:glycosyltransferase [Salinicola rhizosphaerae]|uniref:Dolichol-phosphate mannosyltransferase n=1 Tax=Salinicola rhizosphaerae TaxID=1443141 RepID=A0ABQ3EDA4_9GAMM|nr:glycosyltransferase [Salinicola rhizosphaerae]GHB28640.1 dolichol-phosphate mannosyltransferase [Salinicola rhizosphaerae]
MLALPSLSIVIVVADARHRVADIIAETRRALVHASDLEFVVIDDATDDDTARGLVAMAAQDDRVRLYRQATPVGNDAALWQASSEAASEWIITLDAYGRDDPNDLPTMIADARHQGLTLVEGVPLGPHCRWRATMRRAGQAMGVAGPEGGKGGLRVVQREALLALPCVDRLQAFLPLLIRRGGGCVGSCPVNVRHVDQAPSASWRSAPSQRLADTRDWLGMWWLSRRWHAKRLSGRGRQRAYAR